MNSNSVPKGFKQTEVGVVSEEWEVVRLGEITAPRSERVDPRKTTNQEFCVELEHIESSTGRLLGSTTTNPDSSLKTIFQPGDILFGKLRSYLRKYWFAERGGVCSTEIWVLATKNKKIINEFLFQIIKTDLFIEASGVSFGTHMPRSDWGVVKNFQFTLPPLPEQRAIATALSDVDALLAKQEALIAKKRDIKQATMQQLLTGQTRLPGFSGAWEVKRLGEICSMKSGEGITSEDIDDYSRYPCYGGNGLRGYTTRFTHDGRFGLIGRQGALCGNVVLVSGKFFASEHAIVVTTGDKTNIDWLVFAIDRLNLNRLSESSAQPGLSVAKLLKLSIVFPLREEQTAIATILSDIDVEITALEQRRAKTRAIKQAMMQELLTGRVRLVDGAAG